MKFRFERQQLNYLIIGFLTLLVTVMATSFVLRVAVTPPVSASIINDVSKSTAQEVIQVNILNACGAKGLATKTKDYLRARGFDVVEVGNHSEVYSKSMIIDRLGDLNSSKQVAYALGIKDSLVKSVIDSNMFLRATVIIGSDYSELNPFNE
ncbi:LytR C-terminal domain-containing protein [Candidatus Kapaibacterium sp.]